MLGHGEAEIGVHLRLDVSILNCSGTVQLEILTQTLGEFVAPHMYSMLLALWKKPLYWVQEEDGERERCFHS